MQNNLLRSTYPKNVEKVIISLVDDRIMNMLLSYSLYFTHVLWFRETCRSIEPRDIR